MGIGRFLFRTGSSLVKQYEQKKRNDTFAGEYDQIADYEADFSKDIYLFLRPLLLGGTIRFADVANDRPGELITFEDLFTTSVRLDGVRAPVCVGQGGEKWGPDRIHFDSEWTRKIIPLFKRAVAIVSMPGYTEGCLKESYLIRNKPELLAKTVFVMPPLACYRPPVLQDFRGKALSESIEEFAQRVVHEHRERIGLHFPEPQRETGLFMTFDHATGHVRESMSWQRLERRHRHTSSLGSVSHESWSEPYLSQERMTAAIRMTRRA